MNDASEVLAVIFDCLHRSFTPRSSVSDTESVASSCLGSWDCANNSCIAHSFFGMDIFERMNCYNCALESRRLMYTSFFHNINASALRTMKVSIWKNTVSWFSFSLVHEKSQISRGVFYMLIGSSFPLFASGYVFREPF